MKSILYEISRMTIRKEYSCENYLSVMETLHKDYPQIISDNLIDAIWLLGFIIEKKTDTEEDKETIQTFSNMVNNLLKRKIISQNNLIEKLEESSLFYCGLINDRKSFTTKIKRINSKITYEQQKFNLLREESEGFSKLIFLLSSIKITSENKEKYIQKLLSLIGFFDLDPNRVLDIVLSSFQNDPFNLNYLDLIKLFNRNALPQLMGFKISHSTEENIFTIAAQLIKHEIIDLIEVLPHLTPSPSEIQKVFNSQIATAEEYSKTLQSRVSKELSLMSGVMSTSSENPTQNANYFVNFSDILSEFYTTDLGNNNFYKLFEGLVKVRAQDKCELMYSIMEKFYDPMKSPSLVNTLCEVTNWMIEPIFSQYSLKKFFVKNQINNNDLNDDYSNKKSNDTDMIIDSFSESQMVIENENGNFNNSNNSNNSNNFSLKEFKQIYTAEEFIHYLPRILKYLTLGLSSDQILFTKILIIFKANDKIFFEENKTEYSKIIFNLIIEVLLPSLSLIDPTPSIVNDLWSLIYKFDYSKRYEIYHYWSEKLYTSHPALYIKHGVVLKETAKWHKTLSKENQRAHGRTLGILSNANPVIVFDNVIRFLTSYDNQINVFIQTLSFCSNLSYDVITYIICKILADPQKEKLNENIGEIASWFKYFAYFIGHYYKKFHFAEISGVIYYLTSRLKETNNYIEFYIMKEIIDKMTGIMVIEEMNEVQVCSIAGGTYLYLETLDLIKEFKSIKKPIQTLMKFFIQNSSPVKLTNVNEHNINNLNHSQISNDLSINNIHDGNFNQLNNNKHSPVLHINSFEVNHATNNDSISFTSFLLILINIRRQNIIFNSLFTQSKVIGYLYDYLQNINVQLVQFLSMHNEAEAYSKFLPDWRLEKYVVNYNLQPESIFFLVRGKLKPVYEMENGEYTDYMNQFMSVLDTHQSLNKNANQEFDALYLERTPFLDDIYKEVWKYITPQLYFLFWALQLKDIYVPLNLYEKEIEKNKKDSERLNEEAKTNPELQSKNKKEIEKIKINVENLDNERENVTKNSERVIEFLENKKSNLLDESVIPKANRRDISRYLIQYCLYPRLIFSKVEAIYSAKMLILLINLKIQNINVFDIMQKIVKFLLPCILCLTESEAQNLGVFLLEILKTLKLWQEENTWENECFVNPSFSRNLDTASPVDLADFKKTRNAMIVLNTVNSVYPPTKDIAHDLTSSIEKALDKFAKFEDLTMMMKRYRDILQSKKINLPSENDIVGEAKEKDKESLIKTNGEKKKKKSKEREKEKKKEDSNASRTPDIKKKSPEDYRNYKNRK